MEMHETTVPVTDRGPQKQTASGRLIHLLDYQVEDVDIGDIAHHLAISTRWTGATAEPISIAWHSLNAMRYVRRKTNDPVLSLAALMHDAHEYLTGDMCFPMKVAMEQLAPGVIAKIERDIQHKIHEAVGLPWCLDRVDAEMVKRGDEYATAIEALFFLVQPQGDDWRIHLPEVEDIDILHLKLNTDWRVSRDEFLEQFAVLRSRI